jgi:hypothetical protein
MIVCNNGPTQPSGPPQVSLKELYDSTVYNGWVPDSGSQYVAYDTVTIFNEINGAAQPYVEAGLVTFTLKHLENTNLSCLIWMMNLGTSAKAVALFHTTIVKYNASTAVPTFGSSDASYAVQAGGNINVYAHFNQFYFELDLTGYDNVSDSIKDAQYFLTKYKAIIG